MPEPSAAVWEEVSQWPFRAPEPALAESWSEREWQAAKRAVLVHGLAPLLGASKELAVAFHGAPGWFTEYLASQAALNAARVARMRGELGLILGEARKAGLTVLPLKGGALLERELLPVALRPLNDLDLLVREPERAAFEALLGRLDYALSEASPRHHEFTCRRFGTEVVYREGEHPDNPIRVEVHTWVGQELLSAARVEITDSLWRGGATPRALMLHFALHAGANAAKRRLRLIQLIDIARIAPLLDAEDWDWMADESDAPDAGLLTEAALALAARFAGCKVPAAFSRHIPGDLARLLGEAPLHDFTHLGGPLGAAWELRWIAPAKRWRIRLRQIIPVHRLLISPTRLRERYQLPLDANLARAYAIHLSRAALWPAIVLFRLARGIHSN